MLSNWQSVLKNRRPLGNSEEWGKKRIKLGADKPRTRLGTKTVVIEWEDIGTVDGSLIFNIVDPDNKTWAEIATALREMNHIGVAREAAAHRHPKANEVANGKLLIGRKLQ